MRTLLIDNYDSFTYNLCHLVAELLGEPPVVILNDQWTWDRIARERFDRIILSPGPGTPERPADFGVCAEVLRRAEVPVLGICLGHEGLATLCGGRLRHAPEAVHGRASEVFHRGEDLFAGIPQGFRAMRYHSLMVDPGLPPSLELTAWTRDGMVMALRHRERPLFGVQFHPESIGSEYGRELLANFLGVRAAPAPPPQIRVESAPKRRIFWQEAPGFASPEEVFAARFAPHDTAWWLDSSRAEPGLARFSFMGAGGRIVTRMDHLRAALAREPVETTAPFPFHGGFVGCFDYESGLRFVEARRFLAFDHEARKWYAAWMEGEDAEAWVRQMTAPPPALPPAPPPPPVEGRFLLDRDAYLAAVRACLHQIHEGESYQTCLTNRLRFVTPADPFSLYRRLRSANPAPYSAFLRLPGIAVACSSPERFLRITPDGFAESKPIKGTRPRGASPGEDEAIRRELAQNEKERAENLMIVDLIRNDLSRVCEPGTVRAAPLLDVESYATVHQLVSTVRGRLRPGFGPLDAVEAAFPGGSMTGAPKIRTMRILKELENDPRGVYSGAIGFVSFNGAADLNIVIRTAVFSGGQGEIGSGGGIVSLSRPEDEWEEMVLKARAVAAPLGVIV